MNVAIEETGREIRARRAGWRLPVVVFALVLGVQLFLVARAGTDIPFQDQWDVEGHQLYPQWRAGTWHTADLWRAHNEHRILWTQLLDLALFSANGQWDPLVQLTASAVVRAGAAALLAWLLARGTGRRGKWFVGAGVVLVFLPHVAWENALWAFQSSVYFVILFSLAALALLGDPDRGWGRLLGGLAAGIAAQFAIGAGAFVPVVLLGLAGLHAVERRRVDGALAREAWPALVLLALAGLLRVEVPGHAALRAASFGDFFNALGRALAWPHTWMPTAALVLNLPLLAIVALRLAGRRRPAAGEDLVLLIGGWSVVAAGAMAWTRGGGHEFDAGVTIRYVDFLLFLPIANACCAVVLIREAVESRRRFTQLLAVIWGAFLFVGWLGLSAQIMRGFILPRMRDRDYPVRLAQAFQRTGDPAVYAGQPGIYIPHENLPALRSMMADPRMQGALPPSLQPDRPLGPLSKFVRCLLLR